LISSEQGGFLLGVKPACAYQAHQVKLQPGDRVILFSDGVTEALDIHDRLFGPDGVRAAIEQAEGSPRELGERIVEAIKKHAAGRNQGDDITLVCFGRMAKLDET
jgi:sigma-B regulation protein RsbU (phosphoserine phosphatase)